MNITHLLNTSFTSLLFILFTTLNLMACSTEQEPAAGSDTATVNRPPSWNVNANNNHDRTTTTDPAVTDTTATTDPVVTDTTATTTDPVVTDTTTTTTDPVVTDTTASSDPVVTDTTATTTDPVVTDTAVVINLTWVAPGTREDNSPLSLSAIGGYKLYYGNAEGHYTNSVTIYDGSADSYTFSGLAGGTYYFVITTYDTDGRESQYSPVIIKTI